MIYGAVRIRQVEAKMAAAPVLRLGIVQVNMGVFEKRTEALEGHRRHLEQSRQLEDAGELDLIVWPESAYIDGLPRKVPLEVGRVRQDIETPLLFGGVSTEYVDGKHKIYNTVFLADDQGIVRSTYDKTYLLMFGEYLPFGDVFPILYELSPNSGRFTAGSHVRPMTLGEWRISTPVCYEDVLARFTRKMMREAKPHVLINLTNDSWFGDTQEPWIHLVLSQYRAIEHRRLHGARHQQRHQRGGGPTGTDRGSNRPAHSARTFATTSTCSTARRSTAASETGRVGSVSPRLPGCSFVAETRSDE